MKADSKKILSSSLLLGLLLAGTVSCNKKQQPFSSEFFSTDPTPLVTVGQNVPAEITGRIPAKFMVKNAKVTAQTQLMVVFASVGSPIKAGIY